MIASSTFAFNEEYYAQYYSDWMRTRSRFRRFAVPLGVLIVVVGFVLVTQFEGHGYLGIAVIGLGIFHLIDALTYRSRWIKKRLGAGGSKAGQFDFYDDRIHIHSDSSEGHFLLSGFVESTPSDHGIFLIPQEGLSFYIPWESIEPPEALPQVQALLTKRQNKSHRATPTSRRVPDVFP
jgi:hypothetical protein